MQKRPTLAERVAAIQQSVRDDEDPSVREVIRLAINDPALARTRITDDPSLLDARTGLGETALHWLAVENYAEAVQLLIELGAEVDVKNRFGSSALDEAISVGATEAAAVLRRAGSSGD